MRPAIGYQRATAQITARHRQAQRDRPRGPPNDPTTPDSQTPRTQHPGGAPQPSPAARSSCWVPTTPESGYHPRRVHVLEPHLPGYETGKPGTLAAQAQPKGRTPMRNTPPVTDLVTRARTGDKRAWDALIERYAPLVWSICGQCRLGAADAQDVGRNVWLRLVEHLDSLRDPAALPGWLATTTRNECAHVLHAAHRPQPAALGIHVGDIPDEHAGMAEQELLVAERHAALCEAFTHLPPHCQQLLTLLIHDPPMPYAQTSATLGIPVGSIGPLRSRCLQQLRSDPAIAALINADATTTVGRR